MKIVAGNKVKVVWGVLKDKIGVVESVDKCNMMWVRIEGTSQLLNSEMVEKVLTTKR
jgi:transcription antitermination factor NusG